MFASNPILYRRTVGKSDASTTIFRMTKNIFFTFLFLTQPGLLYMSWAYFVQILAVLTKKPEQKKIKWKNFAQKLT